MLALYLLILVAIVVSDLFYSDPLFQLSIEFIPKIASNEVCNTFFQFVTKLGENYIGAIAFAFFFIFTTRD